MNDCELIRDLMPLYADGQASQASRRSIEEHTARCPACKKLLDEMCAPLEPEPEDRTEEILAAWAKKQRRRKLLTAGIVVFSLLLALWGLLEVRFNGTLVYPVEVSEERILKKIPELALTEAELALADTILDAPEIRNRLSETSEDITILETATAEQILSPILPEGARIVEVFTSGHDLTLSYSIGNRYIIIIYHDVDFTGHVDHIYKSVAISSLEEIGSDGNLGKVKAFYELSYAVGADMTQCREVKTRHIWFGFLEYLTEE